ncbi:unnamed protein product [Amoebophrya sp. A120]|nr:unnamed protein product [Amoebophrya sp. A120]|eukprot:GSA120T00008073001.1
MFVASRTTTGALTPQVQSVIGRNLATLGGAAVPITYTSCSAGRFQYLLGGASCTAASSSRCYTTDGSRPQYVMRFGKHRGIAIDQTPKDYQQWLMRERVYQGKPDMAAALEALGYKVDQFDHLPPRSQYGQPRSSFSNSYPRSGGNSFGRSPYRNNYQRKPYIPVEKKWESLKMEGADWLDCRNDKRNPRAPDFKHKEDRDLALWIDSAHTPEWARTYDWDLHFKKVGEEHSAGSGTA